MPIGIVSSVDGKKVDVFAIISKIKQKKKKNGQQMAFADIEDKYGAVEMIVFPNTLAEFGGLLQEGSILRISGTISSRDEDDRKIICSSLQTAPKNLSAIKSSSESPRREEKKKTKKKGLYLRIPDKTCDGYTRAMQIVEIFDGTTPLYIYFTNSGTLWQTPSNMWIDPNPTMLRELKKRIGDKNVALVD